MPRAVADSWIGAHAAGSLAWDWRDGVLIYGMWRLHERTHEARYRTYVRAYMQHHLHGVVVSWSDHTTPALTAAELVLAGDTKVRPLLDQVVSYVMSAERTSHAKLVRHLGGRVPRWFLPSRLPDVWIDSSFHFIPTLMRYREITGEARYEQEAVAQLSGFSAALQDPATGLFTHAYNDAPRDQRVPTFEQRVFWARGNGWMLVTLVDVLSRVRTHDATTRALELRLGRQVDALLATQDASGLFHTLLLDGSSYLETAGSALIAYGLARGARTGLLDARAEASARRAMRGLAGTVRSEGGRILVSGTSLGTNPNARRYRRIGVRSDVSYGVGAWLLAASELWPSNGMW